MTVLCLQKQEQINLLPCESTRSDFSERPREVVKLAREYLVEGYFQIEEARYYVALAQHKKAEINLAFSRNWRRVSLSLFCAAFVVAIVLISIDSAINY